MPSKMRKILKSRRTRSTPASCPRTRAVGVAGLGLEGVSHLSAEAHLHVAHAPQDLDALVRHGPGSLLGTESALGSLWQRGWPGPRPPHCPPPAPSRPEALLLTEAKILLMAASSL